ncbi:hypothetical protein GH714_019677 [Hevea brasiliensis]|uniref:Uncharacterized protein n=1 Tax=Hevea brasiliensis TaxID=3981 RepID=A0A6A6LRB1_HEVBR|nr:hypothetical protein GH714_019677 [Hevea brasiliensis]
MHEACNVKTQRNQVKCRPCETCKVGQMWKPKWPKCSAAFGDILQGGTCELASGAKTTCMKKLQGEECLGKMDEASNKAQDDPLLVEQQAGARSKVLPKFMGSSRLRDELGNIEMRLNKMDHHLINEETRVDKIEDHLVQGEDRFEE